ncbi:DMT family transporter [Saccharomonospora cyanea]|uniref:DMT(Drug/metabolite transporter) superfamily permease n=1 Tax=Saccharomonospora cyanea NA-134 TaxID=882082 RepID=H5XK53_9PSEU|nr:DMT family transporter [Saccharomonospora cyanea]EHR63012.1 DMT(drug/metabolite transporter) superfamily permease [Saccharomonospora cyanea NA-134]
MRPDVLLSAGFVLMWSSGFVGAVLGTAHAGAWTLLLWRFWVVAAVLGGWWLVRRRRAIGLRDVGVHSAIGLLSQGVYLAGVVWSAELGVAAGVAALVAALQPVVTATLSGPLLGERSTPLQWAGLAVGLVGVALVVGDDLGSSSGAPAAAYALPFLAMAGLVVATFAERRATSSLSVVDSLVIQCSASAALFTVVAWTAGEVVVPTSAGFWFAVAWVVVLSTFGGYGTYWLVVRRRSVNHAATLLYLTPPTTMLAGFALFGDTVDVWGFVGLAVSAAAVTLVLRGQRATQPRTRPRALSDPGAMMATCSSTTSSPPPPTSRGDAPARPRPPSSPSC